MPGHGLSVSGLAPSGFGFASDHPVFKFVTCAQNSGPNPAGWSERPSLPPSLTRSASLRVWGTVQVSRASSPHDVPWGTRGVRNEKQSLSLSLLLACLLRGLGPRRNPGPKAYPRNGPQVSLLLPGIEGELGPPGTRPARLLRAVGGSEVG